MSVLLKKATISDLDSSHHRKRLDLLIEGGALTRVEENIEGNFDHSFDLNGFFISPGLVDLWSDFADPGFEHREDLRSGCESAQAGGFTQVAVLPNTNPIRDNKSGIQYLQNQSSDFITQLLPYCSLTKKAKGDELSEIIDLYQNGAIAFTDGRCIQKPDLMIKALKYLQVVNGLLIQKPGEARVEASGVMNEGITSTMLGMKGLPSLAEEIIISRDLQLLEYTGGKIHFANISSARSVELIREGKAKGLEITCSIPVFNLIFDDSSLTSFDSNYKLHPPLRTKFDQEALIEGIKDDTIDAISSTHSPWDIESKKLEFDLAEYGAVSLQTMLPLVLSLENRVSMDIILEKVYRGPRKVLGLVDTKVEIGQMADFVIYSTNEEWVFDGSSNLSRSKNSPVFGRTQLGRVKGIILGDQFKFYGQLASK